MNASRCLILATALLPALATAQQKLESADLFDLQYASEVRIAPDGDRVVYTRSIHDVMCDCVRSNLWVVDADGNDHQPLASGRGSYSSPRWSPSGDRLAYVAQDEAAKNQLYVRWMGSGRTAMITQLIESPGSMAWSPDGESIAFTSTCRQRSRRWPPRPKSPRAPTGPRIRSSSTAWSTATTAAATSTPASTTSSSFRPMVGRRAS